MSLEIVKPASMGEAIEALGRYGGEARPIAGGTALVLMLRQGLVAPPAVVRLDGVPGISSIAVDDGLIRIGAMATLRQVGESAEVRARLPILAGACGLVGNVRVRNAATLAGCLCEADYASDPPAVLAALDARARLERSGGTRELPVLDLITGFYETALMPGELVTEILVPVPPVDAHQVYLKFSTRSSEDRPCVGVSAVLQLDQDHRIADLRVAVGAATERPLRLLEVEQATLGEPAAGDLFAAIGEGLAEAADTINDVRGSAAYRKRMIAVFVRRALEQAARGESGAWRS
ncbi:MAG TPA: xanthine dehydrogenase family protein subunit M [Chloroflexota bacterium]